MLRAFATATLCVFIAGCTGQEKEWSLREGDLDSSFVEVTNPDSELVGNVAYSDWTCNTDYYALLAWQGSRVDESMWAEYSSENSRILVSVAPFNKAHERATGSKLGVPGQALVSPRSELGACDPDLPRTKFHPAGERVSFEVEGDVSPEAIDADMFTLDASEPFGWSEHYVGPFSIDEEWSDSGLEVLAFDDMDERYAQGYYAIVEDAFVAVHVVSSVEPEITAKQVMDVMREKLAADPPSSQYEGPGRIG